MTKDGDRTIVQSFPQPPSGSHLLLIDDKKRGSFALRRKEFTIDKAKEAPSMTPLLHKKHDDLYVEDTIEAYTTTLP